MGFTCRSRNDRDVCLINYAACTSDRDCGGEAVCQLVPPEGPDDLGGRCRPPVPDGLPLGGDCRDPAHRCSSGLCLGGERCTTLCQTGAECGAGFVCALRPIVLGSGEVVDTGFCLAACGGDADCAVPDDGYLCQYGPLTGGAGIVGYCDRPFTGEPVGASCDTRADPPRRCDHRYCEGPEGERYCTQGCVEAGDCPAGWGCEDTPILGTDFSFGLCHRP